MNKLYEVLAVEQDRKQKINVELGKLRKNFLNHPEVYDGLVKRYVSLEEDGEQIPDEERNISQPLSDDLRQTLQVFNDGLRATLQKEETNAGGKARAELRVDDVSFGQLAATSLLAIEGQLSKLRDLYQALPTLDNARRYDFDEQRNLYATEPEVKFRTVKRPKVVVKYEATKEHPAQTELLNLDAQVGRYETTYFSSRVSQSRKQELLDRIDQLLEAVRVARAKANTAEVIKVTVTDKLLDFINK
ncbi:MAG: hypothetical protein AAFZ52_03145 [Bacteroidota bacterium]